MSLVIDASLALSWYFEDERTSDGDAVLGQLVSSGGLVPPLWRLEVANALQMAIRRKRIDAAFRDRALAHLDVLPIFVDPDCDRQVWTATLRLAERFDLTVYDSTYLELAHRRQLALASSDAKLRSAARRLNLTLLGPAGRSPKRTT